MSPCWPSRAFSRACECDRQAGVKPGSASDSSAAHSQALAHAVNWVRLPSVICALTARTLTARTLTACTLTTCALTARTLTTCALTAYVSPARALTACVLTVCSST